MKSSEAEATLQKEESKRASLPPPKNQALEGRQPLAMRRKTIEGLTNQSEQSVHPFPIRWSFICAILFGFFCSYANAQPKPIHLLELPALKEKNKLSTSSWVRFSPNGKYLVCFYRIDEEYHLAIWKTATMKIVDHFQVGSLKASAEYGLPFSFDKQSKYLIYMNEKQFYFYHLDSLKRVSETNRGLGYSEHSLWVNEKKENMTIVSKGHPDLLVVRKFSRNLPFSRVDSEVYSVKRMTSFALSKDTTWLVWSENPEEIEAPLKLHLVDLCRDKSKEWKTEKSTGEITSMQFSNEDKWVASGSEGGSLYLWDVETGKDNAIPTGAECGIRSIGFTPKDNHVVCGSFDHQGKENIYIVSVKEHKVIRSWSDNPKGVLSVSVDLEGNWLAVLGYRGNVNVYDLKKVLPEEK